MPKLDIDFSDIGAFIAAEGIAPPSGPEGKKLARYEDWEPDLNPTQQVAYRSYAPNILLSGERYSGKSYIGGHKVVKHLYEGFNALVFIIVRNRGLATRGGIWEKFHTDILPKWNLGMGLQYSEQRYDQQKNNFISVLNRHGGLSVVVLISIPHENFIHTRVRGPEPSLILVEELTHIGGPAYFSEVREQLGRRLHVGVPHQYIASTNPDGPSHWVYKKFYEEPVLEDGSWDPDYLTLHLPSHENERHVGTAYFEAIRKQYRNDSVGMDRMAKGLWVDRPDGEAIFAAYFGQKNIVGSGSSQIIPNPDFPVIVGYDVGPSFTAVAFMQNIIGQDKILWTVFDEIVMVNQKINFRGLVSEIYRKLAFWQEAVDSELRTVHISGKDTFDAYRQAEGSYDYLDIERISKEISAQGGGNIQPIKLLPAPSFQGSVAARVRLLQDLSAEGRFLISHTCERTKQAYLNLKPPKQKDGEYDPDIAYKIKRSVHLHPFDATSYPIIHFDLGYGKAALRSPEQSSTEIVRFG